MKTPLRRHVRNWVSTVIFLTLSLVTCYISYDFWIQVFTVGSIDNFTYSFMIMSSVIMTVAFLFFSMFSKIQFWKAVKGQK